VVGPMTDGQAGVRYPAIGFAAVESAAEPFECVASFGHNDPPPLCGRQGGGERVANPAGNDVPGFCLW
jgi:hypothetical protein